MADEDAVQTEDQAGQADEIAVNLGAIEDVGTLKKRVALEIPYSEIDRKLNENFGELAILSSQSHESPGYGVRQHIRHRGRVRRQTGPPGVQVAQSLLVQLDVTIFQELPDSLAVAQRQTDLLRGRNTTGPHHDDFLFKVEKDIRTCGSRGEWRQSILALKLAEMALLKEKYQVGPILLLDDVFSELDPKNQQKIKEFARGQQTIVTTTQLGHWRDLKPNSRQILKLENEIKVKKDGLSAPQTISK